MNRWIVLLIVGLFYSFQAGLCNTPRLEAERILEMPSHRSNRRPLGLPGLTATYHLGMRGAIPGSVVRTLSVVLGHVEERQERRFQWLCLQATKASGEQFSVWLLTECYPPASLTAARETTARYIFQEGETDPLEFRHEFSGRAILPSIGGWSHLFPRAPERDSSDNIFPDSVRYLGHFYLLESLRNREYASPPTDAKILELLPDVLIGVPHNTRQKDETRRYDGSDYELIRLAKDDYAEMIEAGMNCFRVDAEQAGWLDRYGVFYWGIGGKEVRYPECLYRSNYLGPTLFLDEPAVCTRDHVIRPRLAADAEFRRILTPQVVFKEFQEYFREVKYQGAPTALLGGLSARSDVDLGDMEFLQENLYTWETMVSSALYQLSEGKGKPPSSMVFEPPGRFGTLRTLPEMNMAYGCQIPVDDPKNLIDIIYGFLRGAARRTDKGWGTSIYGAVDRADAFWFLTHAYDLGAQLFFFWDTHELACVPYSECLALARNLRAHVASHPHRDLKRLIQTADVAILLPPGYNLGHVHMGRGNLWGLGELNLERKNRHGVKYRMVMSNVLTEIERCIRMGLAYDLLWDLEEIRPAGYREVIRMREDGKVEVEVDGEKVLYDEPRIPLRPEGIPPELSVRLSDESGEAPLEVTARADLDERSSPIYYTLGADPQGIYRNMRVSWELYGPGEEDYRFLLQQDRQPRIRNARDKVTVEIDFTITQPGTYRLRAATVDLAGRTAILWKTVTVK